MKLVKSEIINGVLLHVFDNGKKEQFNSRIDALLAYVEKQLGVYEKRGQRKCTIVDLKLSHTMLSRARTDTMEIQPRWLLNMHEWSGIPVEELRLAACLKASVPQHPKARSNHDNLQRLCMADSSSMADR